jgi:hypothetical protein
MAEWKLLAEKLTDEIADLKARLARVIGERDLLLFAISPEDYAKVEAKIVAVSETPDSAISSLKDPFEEIKETLFIQECALAILPGGDPIREAYKAGCETILKSWRDAIEKHRPAAPPETGGQTE